MWGTGRMRARMLGVGRHEGQNVKTGRHDAQNGETGGWPKCGKLAGMRARM
jgi:hypothetical protein